MKEILKSEPCVAFSLAFLVGLLLLAGAHVADGLARQLGLVTSYEHEAAGVFDAKIVLLLIAALAIAIIIRAFVGGIADLVVKQFLGLVWGNLAFVAGALVAAGAFSYLEDGKFIGLLSSAATIAILIGLTGLTFLIGLGARDKSWIIRAIAILGLVAFILLLIPAHPLEVQTA